ILVVSNVAIALTSAKQRHQSNKTRRFSAWGYEDTQEGKTPTDLPRPDRTIASISHHSRHQRSYGHT
ncbi:hypothetical protein, partial [Rhizobium sp. BK376]|uniref:hypothetical protein n=1 Tax=Rhizobium sp. BK376 TaxID=2512149 RepID=UPI001A9EEA90